MAYEREFTKDGVRVMAEIHEGSAGWMIRITPFAGSKVDLEPFREMCSKVFTSSDAAGFEVADLMHGLEWSWVGAWGLKKTAPATKAQKNGDQDLLERAFNALLYSTNVTPDVLRAHWEVPGRDWDAIRTANDIATRLGKPVPFVQPGPERALEKENMGRAYINRIVMVKAFAHKSTDMKRKELPEFEEAFVQGTLEGAKWTPVVIQDPDHGPSYVGNFIQGIGMVHCIFPVKDARPATKDEKKLLLSGTYASTFMPSFKLKKEDFA